MNRCQDHVDPSPLPLSELKERVSQKTYNWLEPSYEEEASWRTSLEETYFLFDKSSEDEEYYERVHEWCSSSTRIDGIGGYFTEDVDQEVEDEDESLRIKYILSDAGGGHGDDLWAASRYMSNIFANRKKCIDILKPLLVKKENANPSAPLLGISIVELGAGAGLPSWTALHCGAKIVCTDQAIANRILCLAECAERNLRLIRSKKINLATEDTARFFNNAENAKVCPCNWGDNKHIEEVLDLINSGNDRDQERRQFDIVVAADCIYNPNFHEVLLESIDKLLSEPGIALLPFALHGNTKDENVWNIVTLAKERGFDVDVVEKNQLIPQSAYMDAKRGLVYMLRLRRGC